MAGATQNITTGSISSNPHSYSVYDENANENKTYTHFKTDGLSGRTVIISPTDYYSNSGNDLVLPSGIAPTKIRVYIGGILFKSGVFYTLPSGSSSYDLPVTSYWGGFRFGVRNNATDCWSMQIPLSGTGKQNITAKSYSGDHSGVLGRVDWGSEAEITFSSSQTVNVKVEIDVIYRYKMTAYPNSVSEGSKTESYNIGSFTVYNFVLDNLSLNTSNVKTKFYKNETFTYSGLVVTANYKYHSSCGGIDAYSTAVTAYTVTAPTMTSGGTKTVKVRFGGVSNSYSITVYTVQSHTHPVISSLRSDNNFRIGESTYTISKSSITYNGTASGYSTTSENLDVSVSGFTTATTGSKTISYSVTATRTGDTYTWTYPIYVYDLSFISINYENCTRAFFCNETFNYNGLVTIAHYGDNDEAGTETVTQSSVSTLPTTVGEHTITVSYKGKTATYSVVRKGITNFDVDIPDEKKRVSKNTIYTKTGITPKVKRLSYDTTNNVKVQDSVYNSFNGTWGIGTSSNNVETVDTSVAGSKNVTFYAEENGQTITVTKQNALFVYEHRSLEVSGISSPVIVYVADQFTTAKFNTTFIPELANIVVKAVTNDNQKETLTRGASANGYRFEPALDSNLSLGNNTIKIVDTDDENVETSFVVQVLVNEINYDGEFTVTGGLTQTYVSVGETIDISNIKVYATMLDGTVQEVSFSAFIEGRETLELTNQDTVGSSYTIKIKVGNKVLDRTFSITLNGISSIENVTASKGTTTAKAYDVGEVFDPDTVSYEIHYVDGSILYDQKGQLTDYRVLPFEYSEGDDNGSPKSIALNFNVRGFTVTLNVYVKRASSLAFVKANNTTPVYQIGDALNLSSNGITIKKTYNNGDEVIVPQSDCTFEFKDNSSSVITGCSVSYLAPRADRTNAFVSVKASQSVYSGSATLTASSISIKVLALKEVKLLDENLNEITEIVVNSGETLGQYIIGCYVSAKLNDSTILESVEITSSFTGCSRSFNDPIISSSPIQATITYTYGVDQKSALFVINNHYLDDISSNIDSVLEENYYVGDELNLDDLVVNKIIVSSDSEDTDYPETTVIYFNTNGEDGYSLSLNGQIINKDGYVFSSAGTYVLNISYRGKNITRNLVVNTVVLTQVEPLIDNTFKPFTNYYDDQYLSLNGLTVRLTYNNGFTKVISYTLVDILDENGDPFNKTQQLLSTSHNGKTLYVSYNENGTTLNPVAIPSNNGVLVVTPKALTSITVEHLPTKSEFTYGDTFSLSGLLVRANFNNGNSETPIFTDLTITGVSSGHVFNPTDDSTFGSITLTVSYTYANVTKTTTFNVSLVKPKIGYLITNASTDAVRKNYQDGDIFTMTGLVITAVMTNGWTTEVSEYSSNASTALNLDSNSHIQMTGNYGYKEIIIEGVNPYDNTDRATVSYMVDVETSGAIVSAILVLDNSVDYKNYYVGDRYNAKGVTWHVTDIDGNVFTSAVFTTSLPIGTLLRSARRMTVQVTYSNGAFSKSETYEIVINLSQTVSLTETNGYQIAIGDINGNLFTEITHEEAVIKLGKQYDSNGKLNSEYYPIFHEDLVSPDDNELVGHENTYGYNVYTGVDFIHDCIGYMDMGLNAEDGTVIRKAHVVLFNDPLNPIDGQGNIEVKFPHYVQGYADKINKCRFGIVYNNRLFVSGNPDYKNCDWHSCEVNISQVKDYNDKSIKDYTYFSDLDYCYYGDGDTAIVGYDTYRDGDLIVVKEGSKHQATLYRRSAKLTVATSADGTTLADGLGELSFPMYDINNNGGIGGLSYRSITNFVGETIVLTKNGLKAITNKDDVYNTAKYTFDVSTFINDKIKEEELKNAFLYVYKEMLLLKTVRGVYVGFYSLRNENNEYEWYFLNNIKADMFFEYEDELYFANNDGEIYRFSEKLKDYKDKSRTFIGVGGATLVVDDEHDKLIASSNYQSQIKEGKPFYLVTSTNITGVNRTTQVYANLGSFVNKNHKENIIINGGVFDQTAYVGLMDANTNTFEIKLFNADGSENESGLLEVRDLFYDGREVYVDQLIGNNYQLTIYKKYFLKKYNSGSDIYQLVDEEGNIANLLGINTIRMSFLVNDLAITYITDIEDYGTSGAKQFSLLGDHGKKLDLIRYNNEIGSYSGVITDEENVKAYFVTSPYALGSLVLTKTIWQWIIANDTQLASYMDVGYLSSRKQGDYDVVVKSSQGTRQLNFEGFNFEKIQFTSDKLPHVYSKSRTVANINFIRFLFKNDKDSNMVLTTLNVVYSVADFTKGVK